MSFPVIQWVRAPGFLCLCWLSTYAAAGYDVHISRKAFWADEEGPQITFEQWRECVRSDPEIVKDPNNGPEDFMVALPEGEFPVWYRADLGEVYTKDPSEPAIIKLQTIAKCLNARVQGDDGGFYSSDP